MTQVAGLASSEYGASQLLLAAVSMGTDFKFTPTAGMVIGVMAPLTMLTGIVNSLSTYWVWQSPIVNWVKLGDSDFIIDGEDDQNLRHLPRGYSRFL
jgi:hypothetical protein